MDERIYLEEYSWVGITGTKYHPYRYNGKWYILNDNQPYSFLDIAAMCMIDDEEELSFLKLKYGG